MGFASGRLLKKLSAFAGALALGLQLMAAPVLAAAPEPASSRNINRNNYSYNWANPVTSYLYEDNGRLVRVETIDGQLVVETYSDQFELLSSQSIAYPLPIWGGFYAGKDYNFAVFGQKNTEESDSREVIRIVKYDKNFKELGSASLKGANTTVPFDAGSLRMDQSGNYLFVRTSHEMYTSSDGRNHQANLSIALDIPSMQIKDSFYRVWNSDNGYVSHSFNQFILADQSGNLVAADHGDAHPRAISLFIYPKGATMPSVSVATREIDLVTFSGQSGDNYTGAMLGGLTETSSGYHVAYNYNLINSSRKVFYAYVSKSSGEKKTVFLNTEQEVSNPFLVDQGNKGTLLFNTAQTSGSTLYYATYSDSGSLGELREESAELSDCQPIVYKGKVTWYVTNNSTPTFYQLSESGLETYESGNLYDITLRPCANGSISVNRTSARAGNEIILTTTPKEGYHINFISIESDNDRVQSLNQVSENEFSFIMPDEPVSISAAFALNLNLPSASSSITLPYQDVDLNNPYLMGIADLYARGIMTGKSDTVFGPEDPILRADICTIFYRMAGQPAIGFANIFSDVPDGYYFSSPISWCYANAITTGYTTGDKAGSFGIGDYVNKEQMITFLYRLVEGAPDVQLCDLSEYPDAAAVSGFARQALGWADYIGLLDQESVLNPQQVLSRSQVAYYISRAIRYMESY